MPGEAFAYWLKAGRHAHARWSNREAVASFEQALTAIGHLPETRERLEQAIDLRFELKTALAPLGEFERFISYLGEAEGLARTLDDQRRLGELSVHMCHTHWMTGHAAKAIPFGRRAHSIAESLEDVPLQVTANLYLGAACLLTGDFRHSEDHLLKVLQLVEGELSRERFGLAEFPAVVARGYLSMLLAARGRFEEGLACCQEGTRLAETLDHPYSLGQVCWYLGYLQIVRGELGDAIRVLERGLALARERNLTYWSVVHTAGLGYAYALLGRTAEGIPLLEHAVSATGTMGFEAAQRVFLMYLAEVVRPRRSDRGRFCARRADPDP